MGVFTDRPFQQGKNFGGDVTNFESTQPSYRSLKEVISLFSEIENLKSDLSEKEMILQTALQNLDPQTKQMINELVNQINNPQIGGKQK